MFESLSDRLGGIFDTLRGKGALREDDVNTAMREIRVALLEADVALPVVKQFIENVKEDAIGQNVIKGVNPAQQVVKIVNDAMVDMLGGKDEDSAKERDLKFASAPCAYLMVGLQGSGKTTSTAKIGKFLTDKHKKKVLMASLDVARPAAQEQLAVLGEQTGVATLEIIKDQSPVEIAKRAMDTGRKEGYDVVMLDTAGRLSIDEELMNEVEAVKNATNPVETLLVADAMTGQDAVNTAQAFDEKVSITGVMLTRVDGDARGGAAMSMKAITGKPIKLLGMGEKWDELEQFHPDRMASRILGMGDVVSLVEKAAETVDREEAEKLAKKFQKGQFDFNDMLAQFKQITKMGGAGSLLKMLPGLGKMTKQLEEAGMGDDALKYQEAIIQSMTPAEREKPALLNASRKKRIAAGSGTSVQDVNKLIKQLQQMQSVMKRMKKMGMGNMMGMMKNMMGSQDAEALMQSMDADALADDMTKAGKNSDPLGSNPFAGGQMPPGLGNMGGNPLGQNPFAGGSFPVTGKGKKGKGKKKK
ncbi:MAG: signal recognition particle protein [Alphaproteobacteria bacterium]|jgi:signal recognition particle subunit SRP54|nr:signal recognition particle protein [Alphaproteobacteria bacterium]MDP7222459.1 signal recognition particle protein [Alphaproteobacteria bacterium]